jgi:hypothetical protein
MIPILWEALGHCRFPIASPQHPRSLLDTGPLLLPCSQRVIFFSTFFILRHGLDLKRDLVLNGDRFLEIVSSFINATNLKSESKCNEFKSFSESGNFVFRYDTVFSFYLYFLHFDEILQKNENAVLTNIFPSVGQFFLFLHSWWGGIFVKLFFVPDKVSNNQNLNFIETHIVSSCLFKQYLWLPVSPFTF